MLSKKFCALPKQVNFLCQAQFVKPLVANHRDYKPQCQEAVRLKVDDIINDNVVITAAENCRKWMSPENGNCCIHGDLHLENVLYSIRDKNIMLIDTDCVRVGPESYDIGLLVSNYVLLYHYHQELCHAEVVWKGPVHTQLMTDMMQLINITLTRYMDGMCHALQDKFESQQVWRQILHFMAVEVIGWIAGPASFDYIDAHPKVMMKCLDTAMSILHVMPNNAAELCNILAQH
uniref:Aminoglycoside phosphotransferase domain-containing protein n=1 Tax=Arion vulgaris TaxID=1028688 RepID=A0A0B6Z2P0_9EUPU